MSEARLIWRYRRERWFRSIGFAATTLAVMFLLGLFGNVLYQGWRGILASEIRLTLTIDPELVGLTGEQNALAYQKLLRRTLYQQHFADLASDRSGRREANRLLSFGAALKLRERVMAEPALVGTTIGYWALASSLTDSHLKYGTDRTVPAAQRLVSDRLLLMLDRLAATDSLRTVFNPLFFIGGDSRDPELAGIGGAVIGSFFSLLVCFVIAFPMAVISALYLEMFAPRNWLLDIVEVNINNLAAVPSVIFGLLGLAVFINFFGLPRSTPLVGGLVLALMTMPTIVISARAAIAAVPASLLHGALSLGATKYQGVIHQVLPQAMPGILTGTILGMARALGETAPLLLIGMVAFIAKAPSSILEPATALPAQIFLWADSPERGFVERTALGIVVLLVFLALLNSAAILLRQRFERQR